EVRTQEHMIPDGESIKTFRRRLLRWFSAHGRDYPWRRTRNPWRVLIAEMMLQRTKADQVEGVYRDFFARFKRPSDAANANARTFRSTLLPLGLHWRISNFRAVARAVAAMPGERVPRTRGELRSLP